MQFSYIFPAVRGIQAGQEYYISMVPLKLLPKMFPYSDEIVLPEYRAQRRINESRIPDIRDYILDNRDNYVFSALSASIDGEFLFKSDNNSALGVLEIDMDARFLINDGQHRKAAIEAALDEDPTLGDETISVVFFADKGLVRSQQMFTDLNKHAVKTSNSLSTLYDSRDEIAVVTKKVIDSVPFLHKYTDKERDILGKNSQNLFTLTAFYKANQKILGKTSNCSFTDEEFLMKYWGLISANIPEWQEVMNRELTKKALRENYIVTLGVTLAAFGLLGKYFYENRDIDMESSLYNMRKVDWLRSNREWLGRAVKYDGKIAKNEEAICLICSKVKTIIGLPLTKEEPRKEEQLIAKGNSDGK